MSYYEMPDKEALLEKFSTDYDTLKELLDTLDEKMINYVPDIEGAWSIKEHIAHIIDSEVNGYVRYKKSILSPGAKIDFGQSDVDQSNILLDYAAQDLDDLLAFFRLLRKLTYDHVKHIPEDKFEHYYIEHPDFGRCSLKFILSIYTEHFDKHLDFIRRNIGLYDQ